jgi:deazaflavin-dependent oxidoreductase (nitroreductase family)
LSSGEYVRLETVGRVTGKPHSVIVRFITMDNKIVIFPQNQGKQDWVANVMKSPQVNVYWAGKTIKGSASVRKIAGLDDPLLAVFTRKYGQAEVRKRYWGQTRYVEVEVTSQSEESDYADLVYAELEAAFDGVAEHYDDHIMGNPMNLWLRNRSVHHLLKVFGRGDRVLEVGCGTGTETLSLAKAGIRVVAVDISSKMLEVLDRKAKDAGLTDMVTTVHTRPDRMKARLQEMALGELDGAYSTYGAVNTDPRLDNFFHDINALIRPGGRLVLGVWNKFCLYEILGYAARMRPSMVVARLRNPVPVGKSRFCVASDAYSVGSLDKIIRPYFRLEQVFGVEIVLPPSNLTRYLPPNPLLALMERIDVGIEAKFPWNRLGDHFLAVYSKPGGFGKSVIVAE